MYTLMVRNRSFDSVTIFEIRTIMKHLEAFENGGPKSPRSTVNYKRKPLPFENFC